MRLLPADSIDAIVCDPPYGLEFMGKEWDKLDGGGAGMTVVGIGERAIPWPSFGGDPHGGANPTCSTCGGRARGAKRCTCTEPAWRVKGDEHAANGRAASAQAQQAWHAAWCAEALRVLKPGGYLLAFGGTRTYHRLACAVEDAGFEIRDSLIWQYGSGFPKSLNVGGGWGTALKPAFEPVVVARKPLIGTVAANVLAHGTGALNIDGCRVGRDAGDVSGWSQSGSKSGSNRAMSGANYARDAKPDAAGRWPANLILTHAPGCGDECAPGCPVAALDAQSGVRTSVVSARGGSSPNPMSWGTSRTDGDKIAGYDDIGGASRFFTTTEYGEDDLPGAEPGAPPFFYHAKASRSEREAGCGDLPARSGAEAVDRDEGSAGTQSPRAGAGRTAANVRNHHPTVKPVSVMRWLVRLVVPKNGLVLDPFAGSGTTGVACVHEDFLFIGIEREAEYADIARARIAHATNNRRAS